ncbi:MAG TPA: glycosyltransferase family 4 protein [Chloroflexota bacterium]|nr:glycosyltransferase family 4 protein [Chloroflexota bacterium]
MTDPLRVSLLTLGDPGQLSGGYLYHRRMASMAPEHGVALEFVSLPDRPFPIASLAARTLGRQIRDTRPDVLIVDSIAAWSLGLIPLPPDLPVVGSLHQPPGGVGQPALRRWVQSKLDVNAHRRCRLLIAASESLATDLKSSGLARDTIVVVPPGRNVAESWDPEPLDLRQGRAMALLCVANWTPAKGIDYLLEAVATLPRELATVHLAGATNVDASYGTLLRRRISHSDLGERVVVHGALTVDQVARLYANADAFALPSFQEAFGTALGEAMAFGLPVIGWNLGNLPFLARDGKEAIILPPGDLAALRAAILLLAGNPALRRDMGQAAAERATSRPTWRDSAERFFAAVREAAYGPHARSFTHGLARPS